MHGLSFTLILLMMLPATAAAQNRGGSESGAPPQRDSVPTWGIAPRTGSPAEGWPNDPLPTWSVAPREGRPTPGVALPQVGLPLPPLGLAPVDAGRHDRRHRGRGRSIVPWPMWVVVTPPVAPPTPPADETTRRPTPNTGNLAFDVHPAGVQVFVDGYYVGTTDDFPVSRNGLVLEAGPHRVDLIAAAHESLTFDVRITPDQSIVYRAVLKPTAPSAPPAPSPAPKLSEPTTFYLIPGCYAGNVHPTESLLRPSCDIAQLITFKR